MYVDKTGNKWFKGILHTHTTLSDGAKSPDLTEGRYLIKPEDRFVRVEVKDKYENYAWWQYCCCHS